MDVTYRVTLYCIAASWPAAITLDESPARPKDRTKQRKNRRRKALGLIGFLLVATTQVSNLARVSVVIDRAGRPRVAPELTR